jgi:hypothetical protein
MATQEGSDSDMACVIPIRPPEPAEFKYEVHASKNGKSVQLYKGNNESQAWWLFDMNRKLKRYTGIHISINHG